MGRLCTYIAIHFDIYYLLKSGITATIIEVRKGKKRLEVLTATLKFISKGLCFLVQF